MRIIGILSTIILVAMVLIFSHVYVAYKSYSRGERDGGQGVLDYAQAVCEQGGVLLKRDDGVIFYCQRGSRS